MEPKRLNKFISDTGFCSRRDADALLEQGRVTVNGKIPAAGTKVTAKDKVRIDDQLLHVREEETVNLVFNKPVGIATSGDPSVKNSIVNALHYPASLQPIGLMDRDADGLIFLSNDTAFVHKMTKADNGFEKEYLVTVDKMISADFLSKIGEGSEPEPDKVAKRNFVSKESPHRFRIVLEPGTNHHVKRMCEALGYKVTHLKRIRIATIKIGSLATGHWRTMTAEEAESLKKLLPKGRKTYLKEKDERENPYLKKRIGKSNPAKARGAFDKAAAPQRTSKFGQGAPANRKTASSKAESTTKHFKEEAKGTAKSGTKSTGASRGGTARKPR